VPNSHLDPLLDQGANDLRFQFEIIKGLSESVRTQTSVMMRMQEQQTDIVARLERIEAKETAQQVKELLARVDSLEAAEQRREGGAKVITAIAKSPAIGWLFAAAAFLWSVITGRLHL
jgi:uncharacterized coiled-coil protein SlyX